MSDWKTKPVIEDGKQLIFDVEPANIRGVDYVVCETLAAAFAVIESHVDGMSDDVRKITITARWVTPEEFALEQEEWVE